jgi:triosephosphate isomerase (TIM)
MRAKLIIGNWKMYGGLKQNALLLNAVREGAEALGAASAVCVPFPYLAQAQSLLEGGPVAWGAQNLSPHAGGAYTGEVSAAMLVDFACTFVLVGHSERRTLFGEDDALVAAKFVAAEQAGLTPVLCVGESLAERESGITERIVGRQLDAVMAVAGVEALRRGVVAYEPVWAIGTGKNATPEQADAVHRYIRGRVGERDAGVAHQLRILYGGSVKAVNAAELLALPDVDGALVGGASLIANEFLSICGAAANIDARGATGSQNA